MTINTSTLIKGSLIAMGGLVAIAAAPALLGAAMASFSGAAALATVVSSASIAEISGVAAGLIFAGAGTAVGYGLYKKCWNYLEANAAKGDGICAVCYLTGAHELLPLLVIGAAVASSLLAFPLGEGVANTVSKMLY